MPRAVEDPRAQIGELSKDSSLRAELSQLRSQRINKRLVLVEGDGEAPGGPGPPGGAFEEFCILGHGLG